MAPLFQSNINLIDDSVDPFATEKSDSNPRTLFDDPLTGNLIDVTQTTPQGYKPATWHTYRCNFKTFIQVVQEALAPGDCIPNHSGSSLTSLKNALFTHVFPQFSMLEHKYVLDLITMGRSLCKSFLKQGVPTKHQCTMNELTLLQDALPSMVLLNGCTAQIDGDPNCPQLKLNTNGKSLNAVLDIGAKVLLINKQKQHYVHLSCGS